MFGIFVNVVFLFLDVIEYCHLKLDSKYIFSYSSNHFNSTNITKTALLITQHVSTTFTVCVDSRARKLLINEGLFIHEALDDRRTLRAAS